MSYSTRLRLVFAVLAALVILTHGSNLVAQSDASVSTAREIAKEGLTAYDQGRYAEANAKLSRALEVVGVPTLALYTARANLKLGRLVRASELYLLATRLDAKGPSESVQVQAQKDAAAERVDLLPKIPRLTVTLEGDDRGEVVVTIDGQVIPRALLGTSQLVDPGHRLIAAKRGDEQVSAEIDIAAGEHKQTSLRFSPREPVPASAVGASPANTNLPTAGRRPSGVPLAGGSSQGHQTGRILGWTSIGLGTAGLVFGAVTGVLALSKRASLHDAGCVDNSCYLSQRAEVDRYNTTRTLSTVGFVAGGVLAATGLTLLLTAPKDENGPRTAVVVALRPGSAHLEGTF